MANEMKYKNMAQCLQCGDVIHSKHRHDFVWCSCQLIYIDGGDDYWKQGGDPNYFKRLFVEMDEY